jgi:spore coat protein U-like protein
LPVRRLLAICLALLAPSGALAQSCNFSISPVVFVNVDTLSGANTDITTSVTISCTGVSLTTIRICPSIGAGGGGAISTARQMISGSSILNYQLYQDAGRTVVWGSYDWALPGTPPTINLPLALNGTGSTSQTIYARVFGGQGTAVPGSYTSAFSATDDDFVYGTTLGILPCPNVVVIPQHAHPTFTVSASVLSNCNIAATNINFGSQGVLAANIDMTGSLSVTCTAGTAYNIGLDDGHQNAGPTGRAMSLGANKVGYGLYQNSARSLVWGSSIPSNTVGGTGTGSAQPLTVYARVPPQATPPAGVYTDVIVVTVTY